MSQQNPTIPTATQAKGVDAAVNDLQTALSFDLSWLTNGMGRAYRRNKTRSNGASAFLPMVYLGTNFSNDFFNATPDNDKEGQSIIIVGDATHTDFKTGFYGWIEYPISIIFSASLDTIDSALLATEDFTEHLMEDVRDSIRGLLGKSYRVSIDSETREFETVYSEFDISVGNTSKPLLPMTYFRFECTLTVKEDCGNNTLNRCAAILQNLTTSDLLTCILPTYDFSDAATQAATTAQQQSDMTDWLCGAVGTQYTMSYNGINQRIIAQNNALYDFDRLSAYSIESWIKIDFADVAADFRTIIGKRSLVSQAGWELRVQMTTGTLKFVMIESGATRQLNVNTTNVVADGTWVHVMMTTDGTGTAAGTNLYIDGVSDTIQIALDNLTGTILNTEDLNLGAISASFKFIGNIGYTRLWDKELSGAEVTTQYNSGVMLDTPSASGNLVFGHRSGVGALKGFSNFLFPDESGNVVDNVPESVNMVYADRTTNVPT